MIRSQKNQFQKGKIKREQNCWALVWQEERREAGWWSHYPPTSPPVSNRLHQRQQVSIMLYMSLLCFLNGAKRCSMFFFSITLEKCCWNRFFTKKFWETFCKIHPTGNIQQNWNLFRRLSAMSAKGVLVLNAILWPGSSFNRIVILLVMMMVMMKTMMIMMSLLPGTSLKRIVAAMGLTMYQSITPTSQQGVEEEQEVSRIQHHYVLLEQHEDGTVDEMY